MYFFGILQSQCPILDFTVIKEFDAECRSSDLPKLMDQFAEPLASPSTQGMLRRSLIPDFREGVHEVVLAQKVG